MELSMTRQERLAFLTDEPRVAVLSIEAVDRGPVSAPVWFTLMSVLLPANRSNTNTSGWLLLSPATRSVASLR